MCMSTHVDRKLAAVTAWWPQMVLMPDRTSQGSELWQVRDVGVADHVQALHSKSLHV